MPTYSWHRLTDAKKSAETKGFSETQRKALSALPVSDATVGPHTA